MAFVSLDQQIKDIIMIGHRRDHVREAKLKKSKYVLYK